MRDLGAWCPSCVPEIHLFSMPQQGDFVWFVKDSSTNGTWVNGERVQKGMSVVLQERDTLRLSSGQPQDILEFTFQGEDHVERQGKRKV